ncbi:peptide ABC transporter permease [Priestia endophytica]|uniref:peptide ABC transporter permease n=1 Tax=Priestia endophytica TaxID=135735 RepID=UPI002E25058A|nr:peptide ABC transporter permease [Priestia endophytica]
MAHPDDIKELVYINGNVNDKCFLTHGIEFREFLASLPTELSNLLLLKHNYEDSDFHMGTFMNYVEKEQITELVKEPIRTYSEFCWIDIDDTSLLDSLEPEEKAALLYLGHYKKPLSSPLFRKHLDYPPLPPVLAHTILTLTHDGLLIDFKSMTRSRKDLQIPLYTVGSFFSIDELLQDLSFYKQESSYKAKLIYSRKDDMWDLIY